jgi:hypothetical protein
LKVLSKPLPNMALYGQYMSTTSKVTHYVLAFWRLPKGIGKDMEPMESMPPPPK